MPNKSRKMGPLGLTAYSTSMVNRRISCVPASLRTPALNFPAPVTDPVLLAGRYSELATKPRVVVKREKQSSEWAHSDDEDARRRGHRKLKSQTKATAADETVEALAEDVQRRAQIEGEAAAALEETRSIAESTVTTGSDRTLVER